MCVCVCVCVCDNDAASVLNFFFFVCSYVPHCFFSSVFFFFFAFPADIQLVMCIKAHQLMTCSLLCTENGEFQG